MKVLFLTLLLVLLMLSTWAQDISVTHRNTISSAEKTMHPDTILLDTVCSEKFKYLRYSYFYISTDLILDSLYPEPIFDSLVVYIQFSEDGLIWDRSSKQIHKLAFEATRDWVRSETTIYPDSSWLEWARLVFVCKHRGPQLGAEGEIHNYTYKVQMRGEEP